MITKEAWHLEADEREVSRAIEEFRREWTEEALINLLQVSHRHGTQEKMVELLMRDWAADEVRKLTFHDPRFSYSFQKNRDTHELLVTYTHQIRPRDTRMYSEFVLRPYVGMSQHQRRPLYWLLKAKGPIFSPPSTHHFYSLPKFVAEMLRALGFSPGDLG